MQSPERRGPALKDRLKPMTRRAAALATAFSIAFSGTASGPSSADFDQTYGIFAYGHREPAMIMEKGNIADGFLPVDGKEYGQEDVDLIYNQLREWKDANIEFAAFSWHHIDEVRDKFLKFFFEVMKRPDNPYKEFMATVILEIDSNLKHVPQEMKDEHLAHFKENYFKSAYFLRDKDGKYVLFVFAQENDGLIDNPGYLQGWSDAGEKFGAKMIVEDYVGSSFNPYHNSEHLGYFNYASNAWDIFPSGLDITDDVARVTFSYSKPGDLKRIDYNLEAIRRRTKAAIQSGKEYVVFVSAKEYYEHSEANADVYRVLGEEIPKPVLTTSLISNNDYAQAIAKRGDRLNLIDGPSIRDRLGVK